MDLLFYLQSKQRSPSQLLQGVCFNSFSYITELIFNMCHLPLKHGRTCFHLPKLFLAFCIIPSALDVISPYTGSIFICHPLCEIFNFDAIFSSFRLLFAPPNYLLDARRHFICFTAFLLTFKVIFQLLRIRRNGIILD